MNDSDCYTSVCAVLIIEEAGHDLRFIEEKSPSLSVYSRFCDKDVYYFSGLYRN